MNKIGVAVLSALIFSATTVIGFENHVIDESSTPSFLFVLSANSGSLEGDILTLKGIPLVVYFSDRPNRIAGHMSLKKFVHLWKSGSDSFEADPPNAALSISNAALSIFGESGNQDVVVELMNPQFQEDVLTFDIQTLEGKIPKSFGASSIFLDSARTIVNPQITD